MKKITYLEGLRGLCSFIVIFDHCTNSFYPELRHTGMSTIKDVIAWSPLNIIYSGLPSVYIFFILSGFVLSNKYNRTKDDSVLVSGSIKRYPRLIVPVLFSMIIMWLLSSLSYELLNTHQLLSFKDVIMQSFIFVPFGGGSLTNSVLWTIIYEIYGSFLVFAMLSLFGKYKYKYFIYSIVFVFTINSYYCLFIFGMILNSLYNEGYKFTLNKKLPAALVLLVSFVLMTFPVLRPGVEIGGIYSHLIFFNDITYNRQIVSKIGAMLLFWSMFNLQGATVLFNKKTFQFMGKVSFAVYILHLPVLLFLKHFASYFEHGYERLIAMSVLVYLCTISISYFFEKYIDRNTVIITNKIANYFTKTEQNQKND